VYHVLHMMREFFVLFTVFSWAAFCGFAQNGIKGRGQKGSEGHEVSEQILNRGAVRVLLRKTPDSEVRSALPPLILALNKVCRENEASPISMDSLLRQALEAMTDGLVSHVKQRRSEFPPCTEVQLMVEDLVAARLIGGGQGSNLTETQFWNGKKSDVAQGNFAHPIRDMRLLEDETLSNILSQARDLWKMSRREGVSSAERARLQQASLLQLQLFTLKADANSHLNH